MEIKGSITRGSTETAHLQITVVDGMVSIGVSKQPNEGCQKAVFTLSHFMKGLELLFPSQRKDGINPVTFRGTEANVSLGRLHFGTGGNVKTLKEGIRKSLKEKWLKPTMLEKTITVVVWKEEQPKQPLGHVVIDEEELLTLLKTLTPELERFVTSIPK